MRQPVDGLPSTSSCGATLRANGKVLREGVLVHHSRSVQFSLPRANSRIQARLPIGSMYVAR